MSMKEFFNSINSRQIKAVEIARKLSVQKVSAKNKNKDLSLLTPMPIFISPHIAVSLCPQNCKIYVSSKKKSSKEEKESKNTRLYIFIFLLVVVQQQH